MKRDMQKHIREKKQRAAELIRFANPKSRNRPSMERMMELMIQHIPYRTERPTITKIETTLYSKNSLIKSARFRVETSDGKAFEITAYQHLKDCRTPEQKEEDKTAMFPSGLFTIFHDEIKG